MACCRRAVLGLRAQAMDVPTRCPELEPRPGTVRLRLAGDRRGLDRQGETPSRPEPARPRHRLGPVRARCPRPALRLLRLVRPERDIPELLSLARTVSRWENEIVAAVLTGVTNSVSESLNRLAKLEARLAYGFRNPVNQRRRVRIACTRGTRRRSPNATARKTRLVTRRQHDPGYQGETRFLEAPPFQA